MPLSRCVPASRSAMSLTLTRMPDARGERPTDRNRHTNMLQVPQARHDLDLLLRSQRSSPRARALAEQRRSKRLA